MHVTLLFWLGLLFPGYAAARLVDDSDAECGLPGMLGLSYFWSFALLAPISLAAYLLRLPVAVFSVTCVVLVIASLVLIYRRRWWGPLARVVLAGLGLELALLVVDLVFTGRTGAFYSGDAELHVARIRFLLDHGFSNRGPFVKTETFFWLYHTNLVHAVFAACSQVTLVDYLGVWFVSQVWAKLAIAGGVYYFAWQALRSRWAAWLPTLFLLAGMAPINYLMYPNKLAPLWLVPIGMGVCIAMVRDAPRWRHAVKLAALSFVLGQVHSLYAFFMGLTLAPILGTYLIVRWRRRLDGRLILLGCLLGLLAGAPFMLVARYGGERTPRDPKAPVVRTDGEEELGDRFHELKNGWIMLKFGEFLGDHSTLRLGLAAAGFTGIALMGRRREAAVLAALVAIPMFVLFVPPVCSALRDLMGARWILLRIGPIAGVAVATGALGAAGLAIERFVPRWWARMPVSLAATALGMSLMWSGGEYSWKKYLEDMIKPGAERHEWVDTWRVLQQFYREQIERGSVVLAHPRDGRLLVMLHDCHVVLVDRGGGVDLTAKERREDLTRMFSPKTSWDERKALFAKYGITRVLNTVRSKPLLGWTEGHVRGQVVSPGGYQAIIILDLE